MNLVADYLKSAGLSQAEFATRVGCHASRISHLVNGVKPSEALAVKLETASQGALGCDALLPDTQWMRDGAGKVTGWFTPLPAADQAA